MGLGFWEITIALMVPGILYASWIDFAQRKVPNWLNALIAVIGLCVQGWFFGVSGVGWGLVGMLIGFAVLIGPWVIHGMGAGDVKLMMAIGCWLGPWLTLYSFAAGAIVGGIAAVAMIMSTGRTVHAMANMQTIMVKMRRLDTAFGTFGGAKTFGDTSQLLPYGVPLTAGTIGILLTGYFGGWLS